MKLVTRYVEKPWGRTELPPMFTLGGGQRIGEVWFTADDASDHDLLVKYIFTSEPLSVQVHPDDEEARALGLPRGKNECWYILEAEPGARLSLGLKRETDTDTLRAAALDGSIEQLLDSKPVRPGDFFYVPAGTVHAIGAGISLLEVQQNSDTTYRLYDYGRPRELHLDDGIAVSKPRPYPKGLARRAEPGGKQVLVDGPHFTLVRIEQASHGEDLEGRIRWAIPLVGSVSSDGESATTGECLLAPAGARLALVDGSVVLLAASGRLE
jgi:mannose-6-phosphate isomerase